MIAKRQSDEPAPLQLSQVLRPKLYTVDQAAAVLTISRSSCYRLVLTGQLRSIKIGQLRRIRPEWIELFLDEISREQEASL